MSDIDLKYEYFVGEMVNLLVVQEGIIQTLKMWVTAALDKIKSIVSTELKVIKQAWFGDEGEFRITVDIPEEILDEALTKAKISSTSKLKGTLFEVETILALKEQIPGLNSKVTQKDKDAIEKQLRASIGKKAGTVMKEVKRAARVSSKLILNPISAVGGTITECQSTGAEGMYSGGADKFDLLIKWKKVGVSKKQLDKISLKLYSSKTVTLSNKAIHTFFEDWFSKKHSNAVNKLIDSDKDLKSLQAQEKALSKKVGQKRRKFKKSK